MSEMIDDILDGLAKKAPIPALAKGGFGAPLHNSPKEKWGTDPLQKKAADTPVPEYIRNATLWMIQYGSSGMPVFEKFDNKEFGVIITKLSNNWDATFPLKKKN